MASPGVTRQYSAQCQLSAFPGPVFANGLHPIVGAGGRVTAGWRQVGRNGFFVQAYQSQHQITEQRLHAPVLTVSKVGLFSLQ